MPASQLSQLKAAITSSGLNRKNTSKKDQQKFKKGGSREVDRQKTLAKLEDIRKGLNKFDERETKLKHDVGGRNLKGVTGKPSASKQAGLDQRRQNLLPEHQLRHHTGTFQDRRFGESNPSLSMDDRMLERYTRERQRGQGKKGMFNLEDEEDGLLGGFEDGEALGAMTHGGRNVMDLPGDDFVGMGLGRGDEDEEDARGNIDRRRVAKGHFGGFEDAEEEQPERKKSKAEVMSEVIAKSKEHKHLRQQQKDLDEDMREALDEDIDGLRELLAGPSRPPRAKPEAVDADYDQFVRTLAFEARAKPKDRTKTEEELAVEEKERLEQAEAKRLRRMRGEESDEEGESSKKRKRAAAGGDDLDDDFVDDEEGLLGPGLTREDIENMPAKGSADEESGDEEEAGSGEEDEEEDDDDDDDDDEEEEDNLEDLDDLSQDDLSQDGPVEVVVRKSKGKSKATQAKEIPFTFSCPATIDELEDILYEHEDAAVPIIIQRIRALHHPSLAQGNKEKLQEFLGVLLDYFLVLASRDTPAFSLISTLHPHLIALVKLNPITAAQHFLVKLTLMQKNLTRGLAKGAANTAAKTFPGCPELVILRLIGIVWSTSDFSHPVAAPAVLLMGQYLGQARVRSTSDLASGLFLCTILAQYEALSKRLVPEAIAFVGSSILALLPRRKGSELPKLYPALRAPTCDLSLSTASVPSEVVDLPSVITGEGSDEDKANVLAVALRLTTTYATLYSSFDAFIEIFTPIVRVLETSRVAKLSPGLKNLHSSTLSTLTRMLGHSRTSRQPLTLQAHKPIPIATYAPRFEDDFAPGRHYDPDVERNSTAKVKALYKKEKKGAIRELRKDNRFLAGEKAREKVDKDKAYELKMKRVVGEINLERAEEKEMQREKNREKKRAGRK